MINELLTYEDCSNCRMCCKFEPDELIDAPTFTMEEKEFAISMINKKLNFVKKGSVFQIVLEPYNNKHICPLLCENGCVLGEKKPFDCESWPLYIMKKGKEYVITVSSDCPVVAKLSREKISKFIESEFVVIAEKTVNDYPDMITQYNRDMEIMYIMKKRNQESNKIDCE